VSHEQVHIEHEGQSADVDQGVARVVLSLWRRGFNTVSSCEEITPGFGYIAFESEDDAWRAFKLIPRATELFKPSAEVAAHGDDYGHGPGTTAVLFRSR
jgi:hypothetical protein